jgi:hypothetical protein
MRSNACPLRWQLQQLGSLHFQCLGQLPDDLQTDVGLSRLDPRKIRAVYTGLVRKSLLGPAPRTSQAHDVGAKVLRRSIDKGSRLAA